MFVHTIDYTDFNGNPKSKTLYFNLTKAELTELEMSEKDGFAEYFQRLADEKDNKKILEIFKNIVKMAYGRKSPDGERFIKNEEEYVAFTETEAYSEFLMKMFTDPEFGAEFVYGAIPKGLADEMRKNENGPKAGLTPEEARRRSEALLQGYKKPDLKIVENTIRPTTPEYSTPSTDEGLTYGARMSLPDNPTQEQLVNASTEAIIEWRERTNKNAPIQEPKPAQPVQDSNNTNDAPPTSNQ